MYIFTETESTDINSPTDNIPTAAVVRSIYLLADFVYNSRVGYAASNPMARSRATTSIGMGVFEFFSDFYLLALRDIQLPFWRGRYYYRSPDRRRTTRFRPRGRSSIRSEACPLYQVLYERNRRVQSADCGEFGTRGDPTSSGKKSIVSGRQILRRARDHTAWNAT